MLASTLVSALLLGAVGSQAQTNYYWASGSDYWQNVNAWSPSGSPGTNDATYFTNAATYYVTLTNNVSIAGNFFSNASNTIAAVTLDLGANNLTCIRTGADTFVVAAIPTSTSVVYIASSTQAQGGLVATGSVVVGEYGVGKLSITNGFVVLGAASDPGLIVGEGSNACGTLVISGTNTYVNDQRQIGVGSGNNFGNSVVISNSASLSVGSSFRFGSSSGGGGSSNNTLLLDSGGALYVPNSGTVTIGHRSSTNFPGSYNNTVVIQNGGIWNNGSQSMYIGTSGSGPATGNVLTVIASGTLTNVKSITVTASNTLNLVGGTAQAGSLTCGGIIQGYGKIILTKNGSITAGGFLSPSNSLGPLTISGTSLSLGAGSTTTFQLGTNFCTTAMTGALFVNGTLNLADGGGFTNATYTLFTSTGAMNTNGLTIGTTPNADLTYSLLVVASTSNQLKLVVAPPPVASFTASPTNGTAPSTVTFTDTSVGTITNWYWNLGDGTTTNATTNTLSHTYNAGTYNVSLTIWAYGGSSTNAQNNYIVVTNPPPPVAAFTGSPTIGVAPLAVTFTDGSTGSITNWYWDFGDGATTNFTVETDPSHTYAAGTYNVTLIATGYGGSTTNTQSNYIVSAVPPVASFTGTPTNGTAPLAVTFTDTSAGAITNRCWSFGDSATTNTTATSLSHTYSNGGTYTVSLTIWAYGGTSTNTQANYIVALNPPNLVVNPASLTYGSVTIGQTGSLSFSVINTGDLPLSGTVATASPFAIASGSPYTVAGGQTQTVSVTFTPMAASSFTTNAIFASDGGVSTNTVSGTGLTPGSIGATPAAYDFGTLATGAVAQTTLVVTNSGGTAVSNGTASVSGPFTILSGASFSVPGYGSTNVIVQFAPVATGAFTNNVVFTSANGGMTTSTVNGTGAIVPTASFSADPISDVAPLTVTFTDSSTGTITNRYWDFGDGATTNTTATSLSHTYGSAGTYTVSLTASGPLGANTQTRSGYITAALAGGYALGFDGAQNYARSVPAGNFNPFGLATWECWIRFTNSPPQGGVIMAQTDDWYGDGNGWYIKVNNGTQWEFDWQSGDSLTLSTAGQDLYDGNWHHLAVTCEGTSTWTYKGWTDGQLGGQQDNWGDQVNPALSTITIGAAWNVTTTNGPEQFSPAVIDEVRISSTNWYSATFTPEHCLDSNQYALAYYTMDTAITASLFNSPAGVALDASGNVYVTDNDAIREISPSGTSWVTATIAGLVGKPGNTDGTNGNARFSGPTGLALDGSGRIYVADPGNYAIRLISPVGTNWVTSTIVSNLNSLGGIAVDASNNLFVTDSSHKIVLEITQVGANWVVSTIAGLSGSAGTTDGTNGAARFLGPVGVAVDGGGRLYVADVGTMNSIVRQITPVGTNWVTSTIASGFSILQSVAVDKDDDVYVADAGLISVFQIAHRGTNWVTSTIASGFNWPAGVGVDTSDDVYAADNADATVLRVAPVGTNWVTSTVAGVSQAYGSGDNLAVVPDASGNDLWLVLGGNPAPTFVPGLCVMPPAASFDAIPNNGPWPLMVAFTDTSTGTVTNRFWNLGDGTTTNTAAPVVLHTYASAGTDTVSLTVSGPLGSSSLTQMNYIVVINPPHLAVNPASLTFSSITVGQTNDLSFSVINTGDLPLTVTATSAAPFAVIAGAFNSVGVGQTGAVTVAFTPDSASSFSGSVIFTSNGGDSTNAVAGSGLTPGSISAVPAAYDFGTLATGTLAQTTFVVSNSGGTAVSNGIASVSGPFSILSGSSFSVPGFGSTNVVLQFAPVAAGAFTNNVVFTSANGGATTSTVSGTGAIVPVASFTASPTSGAVPLAVTFTDNSTGTITNRYWSFGDGTTTNTTATSLSQTYGSVGTDTVTLIVSGPVGVSTNTQANYIVVLNPPNLVVNPASLTYGLVTVGDTNTLSFSVINTGDLPLSGTVATAPPFLIVSGSPYNVPAGQTQPVSVAFAPVAGGMVSTNVVFTSNGGALTNIVRGTGLIPGNIGVSPASYSFGTLATGAVAQTTFVVTNSGGTTVSNGAASVSGPFSIL
ncbi:MAG TPA: PKD domain-containing protein, partial [Verrucomicrobiae bacterium]|nr:PKD domain-containing protein [Verrucomicrobiae bacterium]